MTSYELETRKRNIYHEQRGEFEFVVPLASAPAPAYSYVEPVPRKQRGQVYHFFVCVLWCVLALCLLPLTPVLLPFIIGCCILHEMGNRTN